MQAANVKDLSKWAKSRLGSTSGFSTGGASAPTGTQTGTSTTSLQTATGNTPGVGANVAGGKAYQGAAVSGLTSAAGVPSTPQGTEMGSPVANPQQQAANKNPTPGNGPMAPSTTPEVAGADPYGEMNKMYEDLMASHEKSWGATEHMIQRQGQAAARQNAAMNARMGRSIGGGFAGGMAQAMLGTNEQLLDARSQHENKARDLQLAWLDKQIQNQWREEDRGFEREMLDTKLGHDANMLTAQMEQMPDYDVNQMLDERLGSGHGVTAMQWNNVTNEMGNKFRKISETTGDAAPTREEQEKMLLDYFESTGKFPQSDSEWFEMMGYEGYKPQQAQSQAKADEKFRAKYGAEPTDENKWRQWYGGGAR